MFLVDGQLHWSASDLTAAAECEYALLRRLDDVLGRSPKIVAAEDPLQEHIARLGIAHEEGVLAALQKDHDVAVLDHVPAPFTRAGSRPPGLRRWGPSSPTQRLSTKRPSATGSSLVTPTSSSGPPTGGGCATPRSRARPNPRRSSSSVPTPTRSVRLASLGSRAVLRPNELHEAHEARDRGLASLDDR